MGMHGTNDASFAIRRPQLRRLGLMAVRNACKSKIANRNRTVCRRYFRRQDAVCGRIPGIVKETLADICEIPYPGTGVPGCRAVFLAVIWEKARAFESAIRAEIAKGFTILAETECFWPRRRFTGKLAEFYGWRGWFCWWNKSRRCGRGAFRVIIFEDPSPQWQRAASMYGRETIMDVSVCRMKYTCRRMTGHSNRFHSSVNPEETEMEFKALFGRPIADWLAERTGWHIPSAEELERRFMSGDLVRIGDGSRRICYRIPGTGLCVKCYRSDAELDARMRPDGSIETHRLKASVLREISKCRCSDKANTSCQEWRYHQELRQILPPNLLGAFPDVLERVFVPSRGWCLVENEIANADGSAPRSLLSAFRDADPEGRRRLLSRFDDLMAGLCDFAVRFYDPQNVLVQEGENGEERLRIVDFEPATRTLIPVDSLCPECVRMKFRRRVARYRNVYLRKDEGVLES